jgi:hypothetical protein
MVEQSKAAHSQDNAQVPRLGDPAHPLSGSITTTVFEGAQPSLNQLVSRIKEEGILWAEAGALGLMVILPMIGMYIS